MDRDRVDELLDEIEDSLRVEDPYQSIHDAQDIIAKFRLCHQLIECGHSDCDPDECLR